MRLDLLVIFSLVSYRATRFIHSDTFFEATRDRFQNWLVLKGKLWADKIFELSSCPYCISMHVAWMTVLSTMIWVSVPLPVLMWLATSGGSMVVWRFAEHPAETIKVKEAEPKDE